jgi:hypothetical protein
MEIWEEQSIPLIGGSTVTVRLVDALEMSGEPHTELQTRFYIPVEGETVLWGYSLVFCDFLSADYMEQEFRQEVARWERLRSHG